jgi:hypothetical protein
MADFGLDNKWTKTGYDFSGFWTTPPSTSKAADMPKLDLAATNMSGLGSIGNIASGLGSLYLGNKQLGLAEDTFAFNKDMQNKQYAMAKDAYDKNVARAASVGSQMNAGKVGLA